MTLEPYNISEPPGSPLTSLMSILEDEVRLFSPIKGLGAHLEVLDGYSGSESQRETYKNEERGLIWNCIGPNWHIEDETPFGGPRARSEQAYRRVPFFRFFLVSVSCRGFIGWRDRGLAEKMTRWDKELVLALHVNSIMLHPFNYTMKQLRNETASLAVKIMSRPIHGFTRSTDRTTQRITSSKERAWSSKQAAVMVFEEAATRIKICTSSYTTIERQPVFRPSDKSGDYGRLGLRADE
ncbi:hypothetical protein C8J56DRAFT_897748 [Mycena floridula]|nr:hypothetical protein C8J56DRAFT_897748 [Mycena floridula]